MSDDRTSRVRDGMNTRDAVDVARELGARVENVRRTGEIRLSHIAIPESVKFPHWRRRKDAPRHLTAWLRRLERAVAPAASASK